MNMAPSLSNGKAAGNESDPERNTSFRSGKNQKDG
jgi:hypothetical protein